MKLTTPVEISNNLPKLGYNSNILSLGSCFSVHIGNKLAETKHKILQNPCGITYNPISLLSCIKMCISGNSLPEELLIKSGELWAHHDFHGSFNDSVKSLAVQKMNASVTTAHNFLKNVDCVLLTIGTSFVYSLNDKDNKIVNNCHKRPDNLFSRRLLSQQEITQSLIDLIGLIQSFSKRKVAFIFSLSPVRHLKDGAILNQQSKASALLAIHHICNEFEEANYYPAYEILLDELRDYRFYNEDMIHPSKIAIKYIFELFERHCLITNEKEQRDKIYKLIKSLRHRPLHKSSDSYNQFRQNLLEQITDLEAQYELSFNEERQLLNN